jgi:hypothetical protein
VCLNQVCVLTGTRKPRSTHIKSRVQTDLNSATSANPQKTPTIKAIFNSFLGLSDDLIIAKIRAASAGGTLQFDTSVDGLKGLKVAKVSDEVIKVMINPAPAAAQVVVAAAPISNDPNLPPPEVGVYWKNGNAFVFVEGQAISQAKVGARPEACSPTACETNIGTLF